MSKEEPSPHGSGPQWARTWELGNLPNVDLLSTIQEIPFKVSELKWFTYNLAPKTTGFNAEQRAYIDNLQAAPSVSEELNKETGQVITRLNNIQLTMGQGPSVKEEEAQDETETQEPEQLDGSDSEEEPETITSKKDAFFYGGYNPRRKRDLMHCFSDSVAAMGGKHAQKGLLNLCLLVSEVKIGGISVCRLLAQHAEDLEGRVVVKSRNFHSLEGGNSESITRMDNFLTKDNYERYVLGLFITLLLISKMDQTKFTAYLSTKLDVISGAMGVSRLKDLVGIVDVARIRDSIAQGSEICRFGFGVITSLMGTSQARFVQALGGLRLAGAHMILPMVFLQVGHMVGLSSEDFLMEMRIRSIEPSVRVLIKFLNGLRDAAEAGHQLELLMSKMMHPNYWTNLTVKENSKMMFLLIKIAEAFGNATADQIVGMSVGPSFENFATNFAECMEKKYGGGAAELGESDLVIKAKNMKENFSVARQKEMRTKAAPTYEKFPSMSTKFAADLEDEEYFSDNDLA